MSSFEQSPQCLVCGQRLWSQLKEGGLHLSLRMENAWCKVYKLQPSGDWKDMGVGFAAVEADEAPVVFSLVVREGLKDAWHLRVTAGDNIHRQQGAASMIGWADPNEENEYTLSFQDSSACQRIWDDICAVCKVGPDSGNITVRDPNAHGASCGDDSDKGVSEGQARRIAELKEVEVASVQHGEGDATPSLQRTSLSPVARQAVQKRRREAPVDEDGLLPYSSVALSGGDDDRSGDFDPDEAYMQATHAAVGGPARGGTTRRQSFDGSGGTSSTRGHLTASSALELFGLRSPAAAAATQAARPQQQERGSQRAPTVSFLQATAQSPLTHVASRLAQLDARAFSVSDAFDDEAYNENAFGGRRDSALRVDSGAAAHGLPSTPSVATLPAIAAALQKSTLRSFLTSDDAVASWIPLVLSAIVESTQNAAEPPATSPNAATATIIRTLLSYEELYEALCGDGLYIQLLAAIESALGLRCKSLTDAYKGARFRQPVPIENASLVTQIQFCYRMAFLKDHALPRHFDEQVLATLTSAVANCQQAVLSSVIGDASFVRKLVGVLREPVSGPPHALDQFRRKAEIALAGLPDLATAECRISASTVWQSFVLSEDSALSQPDSRSPREECLRFLSECLAATRSQILQARATFLQALCRATSTPAQLFAALEVVLADRHATRLEVSITLDLLQAFASDAHILHQQAQMQMQAPLHMQGQLRSKGLGSDPLRRHLVAQAARVVNVPQPSVKAPLPPPDPAVEGSDVGGSYGALLLSLMRSPVDDGTSIRLYEKVFSLACLGGLPSEWLSMPTEALRRALSSFNVIRASRGEHGSLVPPPTERTGLLSALVWRAVDDPEPAICSASLELLRAVLDVAVADCSEVPIEDLGAIVQSFYDAYAPWLIQPFCSARLQPQIVIPDPKAVSALSDRSDAPSSERSSALVQQLCPWFLDARIGGESSFSKQSKQVIVEFIMATYISHAFRFKYLQMRHKIFIRMLRLLCYSEKHLALLAVQAVRSAMSSSDDFYSKSLMGDYVLSPIFAVAALRCGKHDALEGAVLDFFVSLKDQATHSALRGPYRRVSLILDDDMRKFAMLAVDVDEGTRATLVPTMPSSQPTVASTPSAAWQRGGAVEFVVGSSESSFDSRAEIDYFDADEIDSLDDQVGPPAPAISPPESAGSSVRRAAPASPTASNVSRGLRSIAVPLPVSAASVSAAAHAGVVFSERDPFAFDCDDDNSSRAVVSPAGPAVVAPVVAPVSLAASAVAPVADFDAFRFSSKVIDEPEVEFRTTVMLPGLSAVKRTKLAVVLKSASLPAAPAPVSPPTSPKDTDLAGSHCSPPARTTAYEVQNDKRSSPSAFSTAPSSNAVSPSPAPSTSMRPRVSLVDYGLNDEDDSATAGDPGDCSNGWTQISEMDT